MEELKRICRRCGFVFYGQRTGKCPSCDQSAFTKSDELYSISPTDIRRFEEFDRKGGDIMTFCATSSKNVTTIQTSPKKEWVTLSVLGALITFQRSAEGPLIIYSQLNDDGVGMEDFPPKIIAEAVQIATAAMQ